MDINKSLQVALEYHRSGNLKKAEDIYIEILKKHPNDADALHLYGVLQHRSGNLESAIRLFKKAIVIDPNFAEAYNNLGNAIRDKGSLKEAIIYYQKALQIDPNFAIGHNNIGNVYLETDQPDKAKEFFKKALQIDPNFAEAYNNLGKALFDIGNHNEAILYCQRAIQIKPDYAEAYYNLGSVLVEEIHLNEAIKCFQKALQIKPDFASAHWNLSHTLLLSGKFEEGWKEYEWRWKLKGVMQERNFPQPQWDGHDINSRFILLHAEQGFGDTIQFIRYAPLVAQRGAKVIVECQQELVSLLKNVEGVYNVVSYGKTLPAFDVHCPLLSLPLLFDTKLETIPARIPYIRADATLVQKWRNRIGDVGSAIKIGLVWAGNPKLKFGHSRSCTLSAFALLSEFNEITLYSLQKEKASEDAKNPPEGMKIIDYMDDVNDFSDTAAFIQNLDLIISVDTSVAHLAGALGKPAWILLPFVPDWRWMTDRTDAPWYPTMRLFRQPSRGDWGSVMELVKKELVQFLKK
jgi:tetratricopeptide (TPR) repeat protein